MKEFKLKTCVVCGKAFKPNSGIQKTCCKKCAKIARNNYQKQYMKNRRDDHERTKFYSKRAFDPIIEKAKNENLSYGQAVAKMEKENGKEHLQKWKKKTAKNISVIT